jgi:hypothetical protein
VPDPEHTDAWAFLGLLLDIEDDSIHGCPLAIE